MPNLIPWTFDTVLRRVRRFATGETVDPAHLPAATTSVQGALSAADKVTLNALPAAQAAQDAALAAHTGASAPHSGHLSGLASLTSAEPNIPGELEVAVASGVSSGTAQLFPVAGQMGVDVERVGNSLRVRRRPRLIAPERMSPVEWYSPRRQRGNKVAGGAGESAATGPLYLPSFLTDNHGTTNHLFPWMVWTGIDYYGLPHNLHARLRGTSLSTTSNKRGYEFGEPVMAGDARDGSLFTWELSGTAQNVGWLDAFFEFAVEVNPTVNDYAGDSLIRFEMPELGATWTGTRDWKARIELRPVGIDGGTARLEFKLYSSSGAVLFEWSGAGAFTGGHNWLTTDARLQVRWRVDRDAATRRDVFDGLYQGERQGTDLLRLTATDYAYTPDVR